MATQVFGLVFLTAGAFILGMSNAAWDAERKEQEPLSSYF